MNVSHLFRDADLVAVEVEGLLVAFTFFVGPVVYLRQRLVGIQIGIDLGTPADRVDFLQQTVAVPNEVSWGFEAG